MSEQKLRAAIAEIHGELAHAEGLTDKDRESLRRLAAELEARLRGPAPQASQETLLHELADRVRELEVAHPVLSASIGRAIDALAFFNL